MWTATSSFDDLVVCHYHEGSMTWRDWLVVQVAHVRRNYYCTLQLIVIYFISSDFANSQLWLNNHKLLFSYIQQRLSLFISFAACKQSSDYSNGGCYLAQACAVLRHDLKRPLNKGQGHSFCCQLISYMPFPIGCQLTFALKRTDDRRLKTNNDFFVFKMFHAYYKGLSFPVSK